MGASATATATITPSGNAVAGDYNITMTASNDEVNQSIQVRTTVDFARGSRLATWYLGGLNLQVEHHLFPKVCHLHYPRLAPVVEQTAAEHGIAYHAHESIGAALASHWRWLRRMGRAPAEAHAP